MQHFTIEEILQLERRKRANMMNYVSGFKSANLIGTKSAKGQLNLAIFNSVVHIGANPPYLGFILRPLTVDRHTYQYIKETGCYTINHVHTSFFKAAHQTAAKYTAKISEFEATGLTPMFKDDFHAPYVAESKIQMGLELQEVQHITCNDTLLVIGKITNLYLPDDSIAEDGHLDLSAQGTAAIGGLDTYYKATKLERLAYAKVAKK
ncbi:MAG: flavin reductase family protein [Bacteroidota bacterium]